MVKNTIRLHWLHLRHFNSLLLQINHNIFHHLLILTRRKRFGREPLLINRAENLRVDLRHLRRPFHLAPHVLQVTIVLQRLTRTRARAPPLATRVLPDVGARSGTPVFRPRPGPAMTLSEARAGPPTRLTAVRAPKTQNCGRSGDFGWFEPGSGVSVATAAPILALVLLPGVGGARRTRSGFRGVRKHEFRNCLFLPALATLVALALLAV